MAKFLDETGVAALWANVKAKGVKIATGTYTGTGTYGSGNPNSLTFSFVPKIVIVYMTPTSGGLQPWYNDTRNLSGWKYSFMWMTGVTGSLNSNSLNDWAQLTFTASGKTLSWYYQSSVANAVGQLNASGTKYYYIAIGEA